MLATGEIVEFWTQNRRRLQRDPSPFQAAVLPAHLQYRSRSVATFPEYGNPRLLQCLGIGEYAILHVRLARVQNVGGLSNLSPQNLRPVCASPSELANPQNRTRSKRHHRKQIGPPSQSIYAYLCSILPPSKELGATLPVGPKYPTRVPPCSKPQQSAPQEFLPGVGAALVGGDPTEMGGDSGSSGRFRALPRCISRRRPRQRVFGPSLSRPPRRPSVGCSAPGTPGPTPSVLSPNLGS